MAVVEVEFGQDVNGDLLVDTGAQRTMIVPRLAQRVGGMSSAIARRSLWGVGGSVSAAVVRLERFAVGTLVLQGHEVLVADLPAFLRVGGLLGLDVLRRFRVTFEFGAGTLVLRTLD